MGNFTEVGNPSNSYSFDVLEIDEYLPLVEIVLEKVKDSAKNTYEINGNLLSDTKEKVTLSEHLDENKRSFILQQLSTNKEKIKLSFKISKGGNDTWDNDGYLEPKLSIKDKNIKIVSSLKVKKRYGDEFGVEIEINSKEKKEFYLDFYANDDEDDYNKGEYENVHCGKVKITFDWCICTEWQTIPPVIPEKKFIGWGHPKVKENCFDYVIEQLRVSGHKVKAKSWKDWSKKKLTKSDGIYQLFLEANVAGMTKGVQKEEFEKAINYLKDALKKGIPVMAGVDDGNKHVNIDKTTEHFVTIIGMGEDKKGKYFLFYDNSVANKTIGTSSKNKLYCNCKESKLEGKGDLKNSYIRNTKKKKYTVTQIRKTK